MHRTLHALLAILLLTFGSQLAACGNSNPYIGTWEGAIEIQNPMLHLGLAFANALSGKRSESNTMPVTILFTEKEFVVFNGSAEERTPIMYRKDDIGYAFSNNNGKIWQRATFKDKNTMQIADPQGVVINLKRIK